MNKYLSFSSPEVRYKEILYGFIWKGLKVERAMEEKGYLLLLLQRGKYLHEVTVSPSGRKVKIQLVKGKTNV